MLLRCYAGADCVLDVTLEGERAKTNFEIKQNDSGAWHVVANTERELTDSRGY